MQQLSNSHRLNVSMRRLFWWDSFVFEMLLRGSLPPSFPSDRKMGWEIFHSNYSQGSWVHSAPRPQRIALSFIGRTGEPTEGRFYADIDSYGHRMHSHPHRFLV